MDFTSLQVVNGSVQLYYESGGDLSLPSLEEVNGSLNISNNSAMDFLYAPALYDSGSLTIRTTPILRLWT